MIYAVLLGVLAGGSVAWAGNPVFKDARDGKKYKTAKIGEQDWMVENLNYKAANSFCYKDKSANCTKYGRLYVWSAAMKACPSGWHLPTKEEYETLLKIEGFDSLLKINLPAGFRNDEGRFYPNEGNFASFWNSTEFDKDGAFTTYVGYDEDGVFVSSYQPDYNKGFAFSVRCIKD